MAIIIKAKLPIGSLAVFIGGKGDLKMRFKNFLTILSLILLLVFPSIGLAGVMFEDNFDAETNEPWIYNYDSFANWNVTDGTVDLDSSRHPGFEALTDNGIFIDLDGTSNNAGTMIQING